MLQLASNKISFPGSYFYLVESWRLTVDWICVFYVRENWKWYERMSALELENQKFDISDLYLTRKKTNIDGISRLRDMIRSMLSGF